MPPSPDTLAALLAGSGTLSRDALQEAWAVCDDPVAMMALLDRLELEWEDDLILLDGDRWTDTIWFRVPEDDQHLIDYRSPGGYTPQAPWTYSRVRVVPGEEEVFLPDVVGGAAFASALRRRLPVLPESK